MSGADLRRDGRFLLFFENQTKFHSPESECSTTVEWGAKFRAAKVLARGPQTTDFLHALGRLRRSHVLFRPSNRFNVGWPTCNSEFSPPGNVGPVVVLRGPSCAPGIPTRTGNEPDRITQAVPLRERRQF